uniref:Baculoviral IAP repeat containing 5b n=1 Tax=Cyclopterus lumpus TaxID=8103 RepID=A0A8C2X071_CYCLU
HKPLNRTVDFLAIMSMFTFADWPFREECNCTPEKMAKAGFVHCPSENEPDVACCFFCLLELEGWEPDDDPWTEHSKRNPNCGYLILKKDFIELTVADYYQMEKERLKVYLVSVPKIDHMLESLKSQLDTM